VFTPIIAVIGAGPAGTTAARLLAERGARVALIEARRLPRPKLCGGGLTPKAQRLTPSSALTTVDRRIHRVELRGGHLPPFRLDEPEAEVAMVERIRFDFALAHAAAAAGADVRDDERVEALAEDSKGVTVKTRRGSLRVDALIAADGDPSTVARRLGLGGPARRHALALEVDLPFASTVPPETAVLSFSVRGGFAWYFPKGQHANVGIGSYRVAPGSGADGHAALRAALVRFAAELGLDAAGRRVAGHWIPQGLRTYRLASRRALLAGDAAAAADPLFGEGIAYAMASGAAAAQAVADWQAGRLDDLRAYDARLRALLGPAFRRLEVTADGVERSVTTAMLGIRLSRWVRRTTVDAIAGRRPPFAVDAACALACTCALRHAAGVDACTGPSAHPQRSFARSGQPRTMAVPEAAEDRR